MFEAHTVMAQDLVTVTPDTPVHEAMALLVERNITGLPVVDAEHRLAGIVSEKDLLRELYGASDTSRQVRDVMTTEVTAFRPDDELTDICECLLNNSFRRVPILDGDRLVGIVSRRDIIKFILTLRAKRQPGPPPGSDA
jgi:CBS domain-containing protein